MSWDVLFYRNRDGIEPANQFLSSLTEAEKRSFQTRVQYLRMKGLRVKKDIMTPVKGVRNLHRLRVKSENNPRFLLCAVRGKRLFILHGFKEKNTRDYKKAVAKALPRRDAVENALK